jgi:predicted ATPase
MNITEIQLRNFRGFKSVSLELKPLTVLIGPNSSGKSAFGHAISALAHAQSEYKETVRATLSPRDQKAAENWPVDLGQYANLVTNGCNDRVYIDVRTREGWLKMGFGAVEGVDGLLLSYMSHPLIPSASSTEQTAQHALPLTQKGAESETGSVHPVKMEPAGLELFRPQLPVWQDRTSRTMRPGLNGFLLDTVRWETGTEVPLSSLARVDMQRLLENTTYLRGSRKRPSRGYERGTGAPSALGYAGEWTASVLDDGKQAPVSLLMPPKYPDNVQDIVRLLDTQWQPRQASLKHAVGAWLEHMDLARSVDTMKSPRDETLIELTVALHTEWGKRDITEVGYGISQLLPVLVAGLRQPENGIFIVDLPEAHLHPRPQGALADFFCSLALSGRTVLVETHSEMFFHRLRLHAAMNKTLMTNIAVYFCDPPGPNGLCGELRRIGLESDGQPKWPEKFLQEAWEVESQISAAREARRLSEG